MPLCARGLRDGVQRHAHRIGQRLVLVPDQLRQVVEKVLVVDDDLVVARAVALGHAARANASSSEAASPSMATENVLTGRSASSAISATFRLESTPPDRNAPYGTSLIMRSPIDSRTSASRRSTYSSGARDRRARPGRAAAASSARACAGPTSGRRSGGGRAAASDTPSNSVRGRGRRGERQVQRQRRPRSVARLRPGWANSALISEPNSNAPFGAAKYSGLTPIRSRASSSCRRRLSQIANANMPRRWWTQSGPYSSYRWRMTSASQRERKRWPRASSAGPVVGVVVDLAVEDQPDAIVLVGHRLIAGGQVDDAQAAEAEADRWSGET